MNVYDFDKTIYRGDCTIDFYLYCLRKYPKIAFYIFKQVSGMLLYKMKRINTTQITERFFCFLPEIKNPDTLVNAFWKHHYSKIQEWYLQRKMKTDVIISASPEFLLAPICKKLTISEPIATQMDKYTGKINGINCKGEEKIRRFFEEYPEGMISCFYSDSLTDAPLAAIATKAYLVKGKHRYPWEYHKAAGGNQ